MPDRVLIATCAEYTAGNAEQCEIGNSRRAAYAGVPWIEFDAVSARIAPMMGAILVTRAVTLAGCQAKAALFLLTDRNEKIGESLASDVMSLA
jgi:hypothetical protein